NSSGFIGGQTYLGQGRLETWPYTFACHLRRSGDSRNPGKSADQCGYKSAGNGLNTAVMDRAFAGMTATG
ncbi:MAG: hypothetical protein J4N67_03200, partial [Chloroflexi bacterium]|nr:hypothetical protein [Chloroflexota bacterium]